MVTNNMKQPKNESFIARFKQTAQLKIANENLQQELSEIRSHWGIPTNGFHDYKEEAFISWLKKQKKDKFKLVTSIFDTLRIIKCKPKYFLNKILFYLDHPEQDEGYPSDLYLFEEISTFDALIKEKPFPGIVHYILFNELFIPESNELLLTLDHKYNYPKIIMGSNATMRDLQEFYPIIDWLQKSKNYKKNKTRLKRHFRLMQKILKDGLDSYEIVEEMGLSDHRCEATKNLNRARQIRKRTNKYTTKAN